MKHYDSPSELETVSRFQTNGLLAILSVWVESMQGRGSVENALEGIVSIAGADSAALIECQADEEQTRHVAVFDKAAGKLFSPRQWKAYSPEIIGSSFSGAAAGSVWTKADRLDEDLIEGGRLRSREPEPKEIVAIILEKVDATLSILELQYNTHPRPSGIIAVQMISQHVSCAWCNRIPGITYVPQIRLVTSPDTDSEIQVNSRRILTHENPFSLSRTEFRVCMLLRNGASTKDIANLLGSQEKTVRGHLSSIYSKIGVGSQIELLHRLIGPAENEGLPHSKTA